MTVLERAVDPSLLDHDVLVGTGDPPDRGEKAGVTRGEQDHARISRPD